MTNLRVVGSRQAGSRQSWTCLTKTHLQDRSVQLRTSARPKRRKPHPPRDRGAAIEAADDAGVRHREPGGQRPISDEGLMEFDKLTSSLIAKQRRRSAAAAL